VQSRDQHGQGVQPPVDVLPSFAVITRASAGADPAEHRVVADQLYAPTRGARAARPRNRVGEAALSARAGDLAFADAFSGGSSPGPARGSWTNDRGGVGGPRTLRAPSSAGSRAVLDAWYQPGSPGREAAADADGAARDPEPARRRPPREELWSASARRCLRSCTERSGSWSRTRGGRGARSGGEAASTRPGPARAGDRGGGGIRGPRRGRRGDRRDVVMASPSRSSSRAASSCPAERVGPGGVGPANEDAAECSRRS